MTSLFICPQCHRPAYSNWCEFCTTGGNSRLDRHDALFDDTLLFVAATGAGPTVISDLWAPPGASKYLVGAVFPYAGEETENFLGLSVEKGFCSPQTALDLAATAFIRARTVAWKNRNQHFRTIGLGITASVASKNAHRGDHRIHIAAITNRGTSLEKTVILDKGVGDASRILDEESVRRAAHEVLRAVLMPPNADLVGRFPVPILLDEEIVKHVMARPFFLADGRRGEFAPPDRDRALFFPGAFNPLHDGHRMMMRECAKTLRRPVTISIDIDPVHKAALTGVEMLDRVAMFRAELMMVPGAAIVPSTRHVLFTRGEPLFYDKVTKHPTADWIVGADTLLRLLNPEWGHQLNDMYLTLTKGGTFYVFPCMWKGKLLTVREVLNTYDLLPQRNGSLPPFVREMDEATPDIRSSTIRNP